MPSTTPTTTTPTTAPLIWFTDRSRVKAGLGRCPRQRYLGYHFGETGYGITPRRQSLPLATGIAFHQGQEMTGDILRHTDRLPDLHEKRAIVQTIVSGYQASVEAHGFRGILGSAQTEEIIREQSALTAGLLWAAWQMFWPWFHDAYKVVSVEKERLHFLACSCGAPPLDGPEHIRRGCRGKALMIRTDLLAQRRGGASLAYFEFKTTGNDSAMWTEQWEVDPQLAMGTVDAQALWGAEVSELFIVGLAKGRRMIDRFEDDPLKRQQSPLCYGYLRPGNPPLTHDDWLPSYEWINENGEVKRKTKAHKRRGIWHLAESDWPPYRAYVNNDPELTPEEFWIKFLPESVLRKTCFVLGPMNRQDQQLGAFLRGMAGEEDRWQHVLWELYELQASGYDWSSEVFQATLDRLVPCSWNCRPFGREHECEFVPLCHRHEGWQDPLGSGRYQPRLPHHDPELQQAIARGLLVAEAEVAEEE